MSDNGIDYTKKGVNWASLARDGVFERVPARDLAAAFGVTEQSVHAAKKRWAGSAALKAKASAPKKRRKRRSDAGTGKKLLKDALIALMAKARSTATVKQALKAYQKLDADQG
jgi:hypothetical protein